MYNNNNNNNNNNNESYNIYIVLLYPWKIFNIPEKKFPFLPFFFS